MKWTRGMLQFNYLVCMLTNGSLYADLISFGMRFIVTLQLRG